MSAKTNQKIIEIIGVGMLISFLLNHVLGNGLLYSVVVELIAVMIAVNIFIIAVRDYQISYNNYFTLLGISYGFIAFFDLLSLLTYAKFDLIRGNNLNLSAQLWLIGRSIEGASLLFAFYFYNKKKIKKFKTIFIYLALSLFLAAATLRWDIFPAIYSTTGVVSNFKIVSEVLIMTAVTAAIILLIKRRESFHDYNFKLLFLAMLTTIIAEIFYIQDLQSIVGHLIKTLSFYLVYLTIIRKMGEEVGKLGQVVKQSPSTVVITDVDGRIEYANPKFTEITGYEYEEVKGANPKLLKSGYHSQEFYNELWETITAGNEWRDEFYNKKKNRECYWEDASISPILNNDGDIDHYLKVGEEITARKEYEKELEEKTQQLKQANDKINEDLNKAKSLHEQFLPSDFPELENLDCATYYQPAEKIGGDFYNILKIDELLIFYIADVTGHGLDGAILNIFIRGAIDSFLLSHSSLDCKLSPSDIIEFVLQEFKKEDFPADYFICLAVGILNLETQELKMVNAGIQIPPLILSSQGEIKEIEEADLPISAVVEMDKYEFNDQVVQLTPGDSLLITTDGLIEEDNQGQKYGITRLKEILAANYYLQPEFMLKEIMNDFHNFSVNEQGADDVTIFSLRCKLDEKIERNWNIKSSMDDFYPLKQEFFKLLNENEIGTDLKQSLLIVLQELVTNAIEHGNQFDKAKKVYVNLVITNYSLYLVIKDEGTGFDWESALACEDLNLEDGNERGRGVMIANMIGDYIGYNQIGNEVHFIKQLE
ncbi:MAG: MASE3 domain-containing protein [Halanaerobacter sp.]